MSIHKSLVLHGKLKRHRNVLTRAERVALLAKENKWKEADTIFGLVKVKNIMRKAKVKKEKKEETAAAVVGPTAAAPQATPATPSHPGGTEQKEKTPPKK